MKLSEQLRAHGVKRWHMAEMSRTQTLAEHQWNVAAIVACAAEHLTVGKGISAAVAKALVHDMDEIHSGDVPSPNKTIIVPSCHIERMVYVADKLEAAWFASHYAIGSVRSFVIKDTAQRYENVVKQCNPMEQKVWAKIAKEMGYE